MMRKHVVHETLKTTWQKQSGEAVFTHLKKQEVLNYEIKIKAMLPTGN